METQVYDVAIIGGGPAGLTAALYTARANLKTLVLAGEKPGGQLTLTTTVENFPGFPDGIEGPDLMVKMRSQAAKFGAKVLEKNVLKIQRNATNYQLLTTDSLFVSRAVIIATGADTKWLGLPNEQRLIGHGVSSCAPCDAFFFRNKKVAVVGGGDSACEEALYLTKFASEVTIIHRRDALRASKIMQDRVKNNPKIKIMFNTEVVDILGKTKVEGLLLKDNSQLSSLNSPFMTDGLFVAIGHSPNSELFEKFVDRDEKGYITRAKIPGLFIAGDVADHQYRQAITAAAYGCMAAMNLEKWLGENG
jgi:thioredoxin reductase (NADPH)